MCRKKEEQIKKLEFKVKMLYNDKRKLERKSKQISPVSQIPNEASDHSGDNSISKSSVILGSVSPSSKKRILQRLKLEPINLVEK